MLHSCVLWGQQIPRCESWLNLPCRQPRQEPGVRVGLDSTMTFTSPAANATLADLGEFGLISALKEGFAQGEHVLIGPGDDAALVAVPDGRVLVSTDLLVETRHFRRDWASAVDIGHKAAAQNLSDINAMGGRATALTVGLAAPPDLPVAWALELAGGIAEEATAVEASVVGGDVTRADAVMIAITVLGTCQGDPVRRSGARPGDIVAICGRQGWAAAGLAVLTRGFRSPRVLVEAHRRPQPPYEAGAQAAALGACFVGRLGSAVCFDEYARGAETAGEYGQTGRSPALSSTERHDVRGSRSRASYRVSLARAEHRDRDHHRIGTGDVAADNRSLHRGGLLGDPAGKLECPGDR